VVAVLTAFGFPALSISRSQRLLVPYQEAGLNPAKYSGFSKGCRDSTVAGWLIHWQCRQAIERQEAPDWVQPLVEINGFPYLLSLSNRTSWGMRFQAGLIWTMIPAART
jgi:hypothetical protein